MFRYITTKKYSSLFIVRNSLDSDNEAIKVHADEIYEERFSFLQMALFSMGFTRTENHSYFIFRPCPLGAFSNSAKENDRECIECPLGMCYRW